MSEPIATQPILPEATIGILGSGQLGKMMAVVAKTMGYRVHVFSSTTDSPTGQVSDLEVVAEFGQLDAVESFARDVDVLTCETENVPLPTLAAAAKFVAAHPGQESLRVSQNRALEKGFMAEHGIPVGGFRVVRSAEQLQEACQGEFPKVLKTTTGGYDGKGQIVIHAAEESAAAWEDLGVTEAILEEWIHYECEFSVIGARSSTGEIAIYEPILNEHREQILDKSTAPFKLPGAFQDRAQGIVKEILEKLNTIGVLTVEFFHTSDGVLVNEIAPRPHNSGHLTIEAHATSQFEQHIRAICGLKLGNTRQLRPAVMLNLLGECWGADGVDWDVVLSEPGTKLHLYGKATPQPKRKMGHVTCVADTVEEARALAEKIGQALVPQSV